MPSTAAGDEVHFKVKPTTKFEKIFNAWKTRKAVQTGVRFMIDGTQLHEHRTPGEEYMQDLQPLHLDSRLRLACSFCPSGLSLVSLPLLVQRMRTWKTGTQSTPWQSRLAEGDAEQRAALAEAERADTWAYGGDEAVPGGCLCQWHGVKERRQQQEHWKAAAPNAWGMSCSRVMLCKSP